MVSHVPRSIGDVAAAQMPLMRRFAADCNNAGSEPGEDKDGEDRGSRGPGRKATLASPHRGERQPANMEKRSASWARNPRLARTLIAAKSRPVPSRRIASESQIEKAPKSKCPARSLATRNNRVEHQEPVGAMSAITPDADARWTFPVSEAMPGRAYPDKLHPDARRLGRPYRGLSAAATG